MRISRVPRGLFDLFGAQNFGQAPGQVSESIALTVEIGEMFFVQEARATQDSTTAATVAGYYAIYTVPNNNVVCIEQAVGQITLEAGKTASIALACRIANQSARLTQSVAAAASVITTTPAFSGRLWLPAGSTIGLIIDNITAGPLTVASSEQVDVIAVNLRAGG